MVFLPRIPQKMRHRCSMNQFSDIIGQDQIRDHLQDAVKSGHISHAYILSGPKDSGKHFIANIFASAILCTDRQMDSRGMPEPCGSCISCLLKCKSKACLQDGEILASLAGYAVMVTRALDTAIL